MANSDSFQNSAQNQQQGYGEQPIPPGLAFSQAAKELMEAALGMQENPEVQAFIKDSYAKLEAMCAKAYPDAELQWQDIGEASAPEESEDKAEDEEEPEDEPAPEEDESTPDEDDDFDNDESMDFLDGDKDEEGSASDEVDSGEDSPDEDMSSDDGDEDDAPDSQDQSKPAKSSKPSKSDEDEEDDEDDALMKSLARRMAETQASIAITNKKISMMTGRVD